MKTNTAGTEWNNADNQSRVKLANRSGIPEGLVAFDWSYLSLPVCAKIAAEVAKDEAERQVLRGERPRYEAAK